jgi:hypothetical protein
MIRKFLPPPRNGAAAFSFLGTRRCSQNIYSRKSNKRLIFGAKYDMM